MTDPDAPIPCPECSGSGLVTVMWRGFPASVADAAECSCCRGSGTITLAHARRLADGKAMRQARIAAGKSLREAAREAGITARDLADIEWGRT